MHSAIIILGIVLIFVIVGALWTLISFKRKPSPPPNAPPSGSGANNNTGGTDANAPRTEKIDEDLISGEEEERPVGAATGAVGGVLGAAMGTIAGALAQDKNAAINELAKHQNVIDDIARYSNRRQIADDVVADRDAIIRQIDSLSEEDKQKVMSYLENSYISGDDDQDQSIKPNYSSNFD